MSFRKLDTLLWFAVAVMAIAGCKKDEDTTETPPALNGTLTFSIKSFLAPEETVTLKPEGLTHPDNGIIGYSWKITPGMEAADTTRNYEGLDKEGKESDGSFTYKFSKALTTYTIVCTAFAKGYGNSTTTTYTTVVKPGIDGSITGTGIEADDTRKITFNGIDYYYVSHNGLDWMRNNLANTDYGAAYSNIESISNVLGRYYSYDEADDACPEGWRLPKDEEWRALAESVNEGSRTDEAFATIPGIAAHFMADIKMNGKEMWEYWPEVGNLLNTAGIALMPSGYANLGKKTSDNKYPNASFRGVYEYAAYWTGDEPVDGMANYRYLICDQPDMFTGRGDIQTFGANVRCVRPIANQ